MLLPLVWERLYDDQVRCRPLQDQVPSIFDISSTWAQDSSRREVVFPSSLPCVEAELYLNLCRPESERQDRPDIEPDPCRGP